MEGGQGPLRRTDDAGNAPLLQDLPHLSLHGIGDQDSEGLDQIERPQQRGHPGGDVQRAEGPAQTPDGQGQRRDHGAVLHHDDEPLPLREAGLYKGPLARVRQTQELRAVVPLPLPPVAGLAAVVQDALADQFVESLRHMRPP